MLGPHSVCFVFDLSQTAHIGWVFAIFYRRIIAKHSELLIIEHDVRHNQNVFIFFEYLKCDKISLVPKNAAVKHRPAFFAKGLSFSRSDNDTPSKARYDYSQGNLMNRKPLSHFFKSVLTVIATGIFSFSEEPNFFPFVANWDDTTAGSAIDLSGMNAKPAGVNGRIIVKDGHFVESKTGARIKFLGVNFTGKADFPTQKDAERVAIRLARMGVNIVRIHHHDNRSVRGATELWDPTPGPAKFSEEGFDKLDYLIAQFKKQGIYVNLNLHVGRSYLPSDGFPESVLQIKSEFHKRVDNFDARMIELQKEFAKNYLTHVNKHTGLSYVADPCVAVVEINNENSLTGWVDDRIGFFENLPEPFRGELGTLWNSWLKKRYGTDAALLSSWGQGLNDKAAASPVFSEATAPSWSLEDSTGAAKITPSGKASEEGPADVRIECPKKADADWKVQAGISKLDLKDNTAYLLSFRARAEVDRPLRIYSSLDMPDYHYNGLTERLSLTKDWKTFRFIFKAEKTIPLHARLMFVLGGAEGAVELADVKLRAVSPKDLVSEGQTLAGGTIPVAAHTTPAALADWTRFLVDTERAYADEMRAYIRKELGVKSCLIDSQVEYGAMAGFVREADSDFIDGHAYWQHPKFPGRPWDGANWTVENTPMVNDLADGKTVTFHRLALNRLAGKPYTVSEYNHAAPSDYASEMMPLIASFAALQDWDMVYEFDYGGYDDSIPRNRIQYFFGLGQNTAKEAFFPASALIFRGGAVAPLSGTTTLHLGSAGLEAALYSGPEWSKANGGVNPDLLTSKFQINMGAKSAESSLATEAPSKTPKSSVRTWKGKKGSLYAAEGEAAIAAAGFFGGERFEIGPLAFDFPVFGNGFAAFTLAAADLKPLAKSSRMILTLMGKAENLNMVWNAARTSVSTNWGSGPVQAEGIPAAITLKKIPVKHVWALGPSGEKLKELKLTLNGDAVSFALSPEYKTVWYELTR